MRNLLFMSLEDLLKDECATLTLNYHSEVSVPGHIEAHIDIVIDGQVETVSAKGSMPESAINSAVVAAKNLLRLKRNYERNGDNEC